MQILNRTALAVIVGLFLATSRVEAQYASFVASFNQGLGSGIFATGNILGGPTGGGFSFGSLDILTLGQGGDVTVGFNQTIRNGQGVDFSVFENGFEFPTQWVFSEVAFVEVSTNGVTFARFPARYLGPNTPLNLFDTLPMGSFAGLAGSLPVVANTITGVGDPLNPVFSGGDAFDLDDLALDPAVISGAVDLQSINFVRLVDVVAGVDTDSFGAVIYDSHNGSGSDSADFDGLAVINNTSNASPDQPNVEFFLDPTGHLRLRFEDPNGVTDLDGLSFMGSFNLRAFTALDLDFYYDIWIIDATGIEFRSKFPVVGSGLLGVGGVGIRDFAGHVAYDQFVLPG